MRYNSLSAQNIALAVTLAIGNPLTYHNGSTFTWTVRQLTGAVKGSKTMSFTYNSDGIRTSKTVNGVTTTYYLDGSKIVGEETNGNITLYFYDSLRLPKGFKISSINTHGN